jgi:hypothetical protein
VAAAGRSRCFTVAAVTGIAGWLLQALLAQAVRRSGAPVAQVPLPAGAAVL